MIIIGIFNQYKFLIRASDEPWNYLRQHVHAVRILY